MRQAEVTVYLSHACHYCSMAQRLLDTKGVEFAAIVVDGDAGLWEVMEERSGRSTVPQIFIDGRPIGGYTDMLALDRKGTLDGLLFPDKHTSPRPVKETPHE
ncbi:MAG: glutaredoxin 3 [Halothiobacillaceae bacterium]|jgi:glutaredoxin 3|nr:MAG: glutaredoxin 3 [Halothiobacillaceae bacterium]